MIDSCVGQVYRLEVDTTAQRLAPYHLMATVISVIFWVISEHSTETAQ